MSTVFADTSALYAALMADDRHHADALSALDRLERERTDLLTTSYVQLETITLLLARGGPEPVRLYHEAFVPLLEVIWIDAETHGRAMTALLASGSKSVSLTDFTSFAVMREHGLHTAFAFDPDFANQGFHLLP